MMCHYHEWCFEFQTMTDVHQVLQQSKHYKADQILYQKHWFEFSLNHGIKSMENDLSIFIEDEKIWVDGMGNQKILKNILTLLKKSFGRVIYQFNQKEVIW